MKVETFLGKFALQGLWLPTLRIWPIHNVGWLYDEYEKCFSIHLIFFRWVAGINIFWKKKY